MLLDNYTVSQWIAFFFIYSFLGWCIESTIVSVTKKKVTNRGFLWGPLLPLYGFGALTVLASTLWAKDNIIMVYVCGSISATILEYITGVVMEAIFNMRYWDYSTKKLNYKGYICLKSSLFWGVLSVVLVCFAHVPIEEVVLGMGRQYRVWFLGAVVILALIDTIHSFKNAFSMKKLLDYQTSIKNQLLELTARLNEAKEAFKERSTQKQMEFFRKQEEQESSLRKELESAKEYMMNFKTKMSGFPSATSKHFGESLEDFKNYMKNRK